MKKLYKIAGQTLEVSSELKESLVKMLPGFSPFIIEGKSERESDSKEGKIVRFIVGKRRVSQSPKTVVCRFDTKVGHCLFGRAEGRYFFEFEPFSKPACNFHLEIDQESPVARCFLGSNELHGCNLKFSIWVVFAFVGLKRETVPFHSSVIVKDKRAILFLGESGAGKSTHTQLWVKNIPGSTLLNDDSPILRTDGEEILVYGSPWSGKKRCYVNDGYPVAAIVQLEKSNINEISKCGKLEAFAALYSSFPTFLLKDERMEEVICKIISKVLSLFPVYKLKCVPEKESAELVDRMFFNRD